MVERLLAALREDTQTADLPVVVVDDAPVTMTNWGTWVDSELPKLICAESYSLPHAVGTCAMGPRPDEGAVVDTHGRVHDTERLSVVDASIVPNGPAAFTHIPTIMLAERLSEQLAAVV